MPNPIELVRDMERKSEATIAAANGEAARILDDAKTTAEAVIADGIKASGEKSADAIAAAHRENSALMEKFAIELEDEIRSLTEAGREKAPGAAELVYKSIV